MNFIRKIVSFSLIVAVTCALMAACGGGGSSDVGTTTDAATAKSVLEQLHPYDKNCPRCGEPTLALFAGSPNNPGSINDAGLGPRFDKPQGVATDHLGNVYVADTYNSVIRMITPTGVVSTMAGSAGVVGSVDGIGPGASFSHPTGVAVDNGGFVYVADTGNNTIRVITRAGVVSTLAGTAGVTGHANGTGPAASFNTPYGIAVDVGYNVYVADSQNSIIRKISQAGVVTTLAGTAGVVGHTDATGAAASFDEPFGITTDSAGNVYVADSLNATIRKITPAGVVSTLAGTAGVHGSNNAMGAMASFTQPTGVATDSAGNVYVADDYTFIIRKITPAGLVSTLAGTGVYGSNNGPGTKASFTFPFGVAADAAGDVYVADFGNSIIRMINPAGVVSTLAGTAGVPGSADGAPGASFDRPQGVAADSTGNVYVADTYNNSIRKITPAGYVSTLAGTGIMGSSDGDGPAVASFSNPFGVATDSAGNIYVADTGNCTIRKITPAGYVSTLAGTAGTCGSTDGAGAMASFKAPMGVAADGAGNVYVADTGNYTIRKITPAGMVSTFAGTPSTCAPLCLGGSANGTGAAAGFSGPEGVATDSAGNVYVADTLNDTIRKITPAGYVSTFAGTAEAIGHANGTGPAASFYVPSGVAVDGAGNVYVADYGNNTIRRITPAGVVGTLAGVPGYPVFAPGALPGGLYQPFGVAISGTSLYVTNDQIVAVVNNLH